MSSVGYYRYKALVGESDKQIEWFANGVVVTTHTIKPIPYCAEGKILKYLDDNGQYRFYPFNKYYQVSDRPKLIGTTNEFITNIYTDKSSKQNIGYKNDRVLSLSAEVSEDQLTVLSQIYTSPKVYLYNGVGQSDNESDWIEVSIIGGDNIVKRRKAKIGIISLDVQLPEYYTVRKV